MAGLEYSTEQLKRWLDEALKKHQRLSDQYSGVRPGWVSMDLCDLWMDIDQYQKALVDRIGYIAARQCVVDLRDHASQQRQVNTPPTKH